MSLIRKCLAEFFGTFWLVLGAAEPRSSPPLFRASASASSACRSRSVSPC